MSSVPGPPSPTRHDDPDADLPPGRAPAVPGQRARPPLVRVLSEGDWPQVHELLVEAAASGESWDADVPHDVADSRRLWDGPRQVVAVDPADTRRVLGAAVAARAGTGARSHLGTGMVVVAPAHRRTGVGRLLGEHLLAWHREQGRSGVVLDAVVATDDAALALCHALGLRSVGRLPRAHRRPGGGLADVVWFHLDLGPAPYADVQPGERGDERHRVLVAAARRFVERGWTGTTVEDVAAEAGVPVERVHRQLGSKGELLWLSLTHVVSGPGADLHTLVETVGEPGADGVDAWLDELVALVCRLQERIAPLVPVLNEAAALDGVALSMRQGSDLRRLRTSRLIARRLQRGATQEPDAAELVHVLMMSETYLGFVRTGWSTERYADWLRGTLDRAVNGDAAMSPAVATGR